MVSNYQVLEQYALLWKEKNATIFLLIRQHTNIYKNLCFQTNVLEVDGFLRPET